MLGKAYPRAQVCGGLKTSLSSCSAFQSLLIPPCSLISSLASHSSVAREDAAVKVKQQSAARLPVLPAATQLKSPG